MTHELTPHPCKVKKQMTMERKEEIEWQQKDKYVRFLKPFPHYQIDKFNGTKGNVTITPDNIGIYDEKSGMYVFKSTPDDYMKRDVVPQIFSQLLKGVEGKLTKFYDSYFDGPFQDEDDRDLHIRLEVRILKATSQIDVNVARMYFEAGQINRLSIKQSLMRLKTP